MPTQLAAEIDQQSFQIGKAAERSTRALSCGFHELKVAQPDEPAEEEGLPW